MGGSDRLVLGRRQATLVLAFKTPERPDRFTRCSSFVEISENPAQFVLDSSIGSFLNLYAQTRRPRRKLRNQV